jgi:hypothetical protein
LCFSNAFKYNKEEKKREKKSLFFFWLNSFMITSAYSAVSARVKLFNALVSQRLRVVVLFVGAK